MDSVGEGEGGEIWENSIETCIISCTKKKKEFLLKDCISVHKMKMEEKSLNQFFPQLF